MKKALKKILYFFVALPIVLLSVSCSGDDNSGTNDDDGGNPQGHEVMYKVTIEDPVMTNISYRDAEGNMIAATESLDELTTWSKTIEAEGPFSARIEMEFETMAGSPRDYSLQIYVDGELMHSTSGWGSGMVSTELEYQFD